jgi:hypothetical protein
MTNADSDSLRLARALEAEHEAVQALEKLPDAIREAEQVADSLRVSRTQS